MRGKLTLVDIIESSKLIEKSTAPFDGDIEAYVRFCIEWDTVTSALRQHLTADASAEHGGSGDV